MEVVIKIPDEKYKALQKYLESGCALGLVDMAILNGTVLPKEHGDLKDVLDIEYYKFNIWDRGPDYEDLVDMDDIYNNVPTIVKGNIEKEDSNECTN